MVSCMLVRLGKILTVIALVTAVGLHWALLQTVAWTGMLANNLCSESLSQAVANTFDGQHLCPLCRAIAAAKKSEKKSQAIASALKFEFPPVTEALSLPLPPPLMGVVALDPVLKVCPQKPPVPPPRRLFI
jgi:hypothetical protein